MPQEVYLADPVPEGSLTRSGAKLLIPPNTPAKYDYWLKHPGDRPTTEAFDLGHAAHHMVLGIGPELVDIGGDDRRIKEVGARYDAARARGAIPLRSRDWKRVMEMAAALRAHPEAAELLNPDRGKPEQAIVWTEEVVWEGRDGQLHSEVIWRRCLIDWLPDRPAGGRLIVPDYKTADSAHQPTWARSAPKYSYHMQDQWIVQGLQKLLGVEVAVIFILQEKDPPYLVSIAELDGEAKAMGNQRNWEALAIYAECRRTDYWPSYDTLRTVSIPWG
jgi:hypothetical protein